MNVVVCPLISNGMNYSPCRNDCVFFHNNQCLLRELLLAKINDNKSAEENKSVADINNFAGNI